MWAAQKDLFSLTHNALFKQDKAAIHDLQLKLSTNSQMFVNLLQNPAKNAKQRADVKKATTEGLVIPGIRSTQILSSELIDEALILSDLFDLSELSAVELLLTAEQQQSDFPGQARGLVAVVLYYDGQLAVTRTLHTLQQARSGRCWSLSLPDETQAMVDQFGSSLHDSGITQRILNLLNSMTVEASMRKLSEQRALGNNKHRNQVRDLIESVRLSLCESLYCCSAQSGLSRTEMTALINHLKQLSIDTSKPLDDVTLCLVMTMLYSLDVSILEQGDQVEELVQSLPVFSDVDWISSVHLELDTVQQWACPGLQALTQFAWAQTLRSLAQHPVAQDAAEYIERDDGLVDLAVKDGVFAFIRDSLVASTNFHREEFYVRRVHSLVTDFLYMMPLKVKELRNMGDEAARVIQAFQQEGLTPAANIPRDFEHFLTALAALYERDDCDLNLAAEYFNSADTEGSRSYSRKQLALSKFVRTAGDLVPAALFAPYVTFLTSLGNHKHTALHCFSLLKHNSSVVGGSNSVVSIEHLFSALNRYFWSLRQDVSRAAGPLADLSHVYRPAGSSRPQDAASAARGITPTELAGLSAGLKLIAALARHDTSCCLALLETPGWRCVETLFGLLASSVPTTLKADMLSVLAAMAEHSSLCDQLWLALESSQLLCTIPTTNSPATDIRHELDQIESRDEQYPLTRAFVSLLKALLHHPAPLSLGAGRRSPGVLPYLEFIAKDVLMKAPYRAYKNADEKHELSARCLETLSLVLHVQYRVELESLDSPLSASSVWLLCQLLSESQLLATVLKLIGDASAILCKDEPSLVSTGLESSCLHALRLLNQVLCMEDSVLELLRTSSATVIGVKLERLLLGLNPRSGRPDHLLYIARLLTQSRSYTELSLEAVRLLHATASSSSVQKHLLTLLTDDSDIGASILHGFSECVETEELTVRDGSHDVSRDPSTRDLLRLYSLRFLLKSLQLPGPSPAHYLLGYNVQSDVSSTTLQDPGVLGASRTALHSLLAVLDTHGGHMHQPELADMAYRVLYALVSTPDTADTTLRYLRTSHDLLLKHLHRFPILTNDHSALSQLSSVCRCLAVEIRLLSVRQQRSQLKRLVQALVSDTPTQPEQPGDTMSSVWDPDYDAVCSQPETVYRRRRLLRMLDAIPMSVESFETPSLEILPVAAAELAVKEADTLEPEQGVMLTDIRRLHTSLSRLLAAAPPPSRPQMSQEIEAVMSMAVARNASHLSIHRQKSAVEGWRQLLETLLACCPVDVLPKDERLSLALNTIHDLMSKVSDKDTEGALAVPTAGVILMLVTSLRQAVIQPVEEGDRHTDTPSAARAMFTSSVKSITQDIVDHILRSGNQPRVRSNLYGALLMLLQILQSDMNSEHNVEKQRLISECLSTLGSYGDVFIDTVCNDASDAQHIRQLLALSVLSSTLQLDPSHTWLDFLSSRGYLQHLVDSLLLDDESLSQCLAAEPASLRALFTYEAKLSVLCRVAASTRGAQLLLQCSLPLRLADCNVYSLRLAAHSAGTSQVGGSDSFVPDVQARYRQVMRPALRLCLSLLSTLGADNLAAAHKVVHFCVRHRDVLVEMLRAPYEQLHGSEEQLRAERHEILRDLTLVTALLSRTAQGHVQHEEGEVEFSSNVAQLQRAVISQLPLLVARTPTKPQSQADDAGEELLMWLESTLNVLMLCVGLASSPRQPGERGGLNIVIFEPSLENTGSLEVSAGKGPTLSVLYQLLNDSCSRLIHVNSLAGSLAEKLARITEMDADELRQHAGGDHASLELQHSAAAARIRRALSLFSRQCQVLSSLVEMSILLLWRHVQHYLSMPRGVDSQVQSAKRPIRRLQDFTLQPTPLADEQAPMLLSSAQLNALKQQLANMFNESLFAKVAEASAKFSSDHGSYRFSEALIRRLKHLVYIEAVQ